MSLERSFTDYYPDAVTITSQLERRQLRWVFENLDVTGVIIPSDPSKPLKPLR